MSKKYLILYIRGFISPMEEVLIKKGQISYVDHAREVIIGHLLEEIKGVVQVDLDVNVEGYFHDWNFPNNSGVICMVLDDDTCAPVHSPTFSLKDLELEVARITAMVQKEPDKIKTYPLSPHIVLVERVGILIPIEKALIQNGYQEELKLTKGNLEKSYFHHQSNFDDIFNTYVLDIFIDWDFKMDKSMICFVLK
ncbi:uncharacterized protein YbcI [Evansella vedderi]|uniref:Uncharacterized protein YbcI n=2 Tax=Evansella vedderi TaxID=38282 RepID=A0ABU0A0D7_9BACI|nr:uncharacterized protein YbcI [Evansella vedderi]